MRVAVETVRATVRAGCEASLPPALAALAPAEAPADLLQQLACCVTAQAVDNLEDAEVNRPCCPRRTRRTHRSMWAEAGRA